MKKRKMAMRKCLGCQQQFDKRILVRVVRDKFENVSVDLTGRMNGRGAYICKSRDCLEKALKTKSIEKSLEITLSKDIEDELLRQIEEAHE